MVTAIFFGGGGGGVNKRILFQVMIYFDYQGIEVI